MGLTDTGNLNISGGSGAGDATGDLQLKNGLGLDIQSTGTLNVNSGATTLGGNLTVTGITSLNGNTNIQADLSIGAGGGVNFSVGGSTGNIATNGSLTVSGNTDIGTSTTDSLTINSVVDSDIIPSGTGATYNLGSSAQKWGTVHCTAITGPTSFAATNLSGNLTGNVTGNVTGDLTGNADTATTLQSARNIGGVSFNGSQDIDLPGVNTAGNQNTSGTATQADNINIDEANGNTNYQVTFSALNETGYNRQYIDTDNAHLNYNPSTATLSGLNISGSSIQATTFGTSSQNAYGARTISQGNPSGGSNGDIHYKY